MSYWKLLSGSAIHRDMGGMPNLQGVSIQLGRPAWFLPVAALAVAAAVVWISARSRNTDAALAAGLAGSYLLSYHAYPQDALTLLMAFALLPREGLRGWRRAAWHLLASPVPLACALLGAPWHMVLPVTATVALAGLVGAQSMLRGAARERGGMPNRPDGGDTHQSMRSGVLVWSSSLVFRVCGLGFGSPGRTAAPALLRCRTRHCPLDGMVSGGSVCLGERCPSAPWIKVA